MDRLRELAQRFHIPTTLAKFLMVGGVGYLINQAVLFLVYEQNVLWFLAAKETSVSLGLFTLPDIRLLVASIVAVEAAIVAQFNMHERWTFRHRPRSGAGLLRFVRFNLSSSVSPIISVATINVLTPVLGISPFISNTIGVLLGFTWNWTLNALVIWPHLRKDG